MDTIPPDPPTGLTALKSPSSLPQLRWTQASRHDHRRQRHRRVRDLPRRHPGDDGAGLASFDDSTLQDDDTYTYTVTAIDGAGNESDPSDPVQILFDGTPPPVPFGLQVDGDLARAARR